MSTTRLTFLYPHLFRSLRASESSAVRSARRKCQQPRPKNASHRGFATATRREQAFVQRHGKAVEPYLKEGEDPETLKVFVPVDESKDDEKSKELKKISNSSADKNAHGPLSDETQAAARIPGDDGSPENYSSPAEASQEAGNTQQTSLDQAAANTQDTLAPLETILHMPAPQSLDRENEAKPPHLRTPPYVHHFDTYTLVSQVESGGFTKDQSVTAMKAVRGLLAENLDIAQAGLVSKSDVENETYLFRAACSELRTEIQNSRKSHEETMRRERTQLTHEVEILNQKLTQELLGLKDELKGMFDDRKMAVRMEQRDVERAIQELNYKITVLLNSDSKSEVEGLRWVLTRRSVMGILFMAFMVLTSLRYASYRSHEDHEAAKKKEAQRVHDEHFHRDQNTDVPPGAAEILAAN
ncbi:hypothetical protein BP5796_08734 [Coleophoma crateriformis]|uniref:MOZ protein represents a chromatin-associated acetyltransferase n=1 Tax=Coleophoma crateriformis TaxID=565419 RepID=A0A3D8R8G2_9HELO|nr:hypothetical protein BP5796_08734 [Coleophoma crateriformis]